MNFIEFFLNVTKFLASFKIILNEGAEVTIRTIKSQSQVVVLTRFQLIPYGRIGGMATKEILEMLSMMNVKAAPIL